MDKKLPISSNVPLEQGRLIEVEIQREIDDVEMGVLKNGTPYLTEAGLARMCGIDRKVLHRLAENWEEEKDKPRGRIIQEILLESGYTANTLYVESKYNGRSVNAYTEQACIAVLEYYAMHSDNPKPQAIKAYRRLARQSFRDFIYTATKYSPDQRRVESWNNFHDRVNLLHNATPAGYFGVFNEIAGLIVPMIQNGAYVSCHLVPDISVGIQWAKYWKAHNLEEKYGPRIKYNHLYPEYYPQARSNPQDAFAYPDAALGAFRKWLLEEYIRKHYQKYVVSKVKDGTIASKDGRLAVTAFEGKRPLSS